MKKKFFNIINNLLNEVARYKYGSLYKKCLRVNNIPNKKVDGEDEWIEKWSVFGRKPDVTYYRLFSHYIGCDINIVPQDICHNYIELILDPFSFVWYYADKNVFDRLFPSGYFPKTFLRRVRGIYITSQTFGIRCCNG